MYVCLWREREKREKSVLAETALGKLSAPVCARARKAEFSGGVTNEVTGRGSASSVDMKRGEQRGDEQIRF